MLWYQKILYIVGIVKIKNLIISGAQMMSLIVITSVAINSRIRITGLSFFLVVVMGCSRSSEYLSNYPAPVVPTVFAFSRSRELLIGAEREKIIDAAKKHLFGQDSLGNFENIVIIDEGDSWYVYFGLRGNGSFEQTNKRFFSIIYDGVTAVYLDKDSLKEKNIGHEDIKTGLFKYGPEIPMKKIKE
ncbi:hypothetical protein P4C99_21950 [Pontiellaceae bacterium B1224]|nr:hypothetical protein [Pontiellaceae bacterium B1224]